MTANDVTNSTAHVGVRFELSRRLEMDAVQPQRIGGFDVLRIVVDIDRALRIDPASLSGSGRGQAAPRRRHE